MGNKFACAACGAVHDEVNAVAMAECRDCRRLHCRGCLSPQGVCKECEAK